MLKWLTTPVYSLADPVWICVVCLAIHDKEYFAAFLAAMVGATVSGILEYFARR